MIKITHIYKTAKAGLRDNQTELQIDKRDPKFFFTLEADDCCSFKAELKLNGKTQYHLFDVHERQTKRRVDYAFPLGKLPKGEYEAVFIIYVKEVIIEKRNLKLIV